MFKVSVSSIVSAKNSALTIFNNALDKLAKANEKVEQFKKESALRQSKLEAKMSVEQQAQFDAVAQQAEIESISAKIKAILS